MAEEVKTGHVDQAVDQQDRGIFDFMKKDENSSKVHEQEAAVSESADHFKEKVKIEDDQKEKAKEEEKKPSLLEKLHHRSNSSSSSSSSDEEGTEGDEKKKKKEKKGGKDEKKEHHVGEDSRVPVEKVEEHSEEQSKKGLLDKIKGKLPGAAATKTHDQQPPAPPADQHPHEPSPTGSDKEKEKKGFLDKIKEKLPGYHSNTQDQTTGPHDQEH